MATTNKKTTRSHLYSDERLAGGYGPRAAKQTEEAHLRRLVMTCLLWENNAYCDGKSVVEEIKRLIPLVEPKTVADIAIEARYTQKLRHVPLLVVREMARHDSHKGLVGKTLAEVINRPDEISEFLSLYWGSNGGKKSISAQVKKGLSAAFDKFNEYQLAKWSKPGKEVSLKDVIFLSHPKPSQDKEDLYRRLINDELKTPDTWEVGLSAAKSVEEKRAVWERLIGEGRLGSLAFLKNIAGIQRAGVSRNIIAEGFKNLRPSMLLPIDFIRTAKAVPEWSREIEEAMLRCLATFPKLPGWTVFVVDVSGSMTSMLSSKTAMTRLDSAAVMAMLAAEMCEHSVMYATAGSDMARVHRTQRMPALRGFALPNEISKMAQALGGGGIFTRQCLEYIRTQEREQPDRIIVFSDSQDCDHAHQRTPNPFGKKNYIIDVSCHKNGINYQGVWDAEISGWSQHFLSFIAELESVNLQGI